MFPRMSNETRTLGRVPVWTVGDRLKKARTTANVSAEEMAEILTRGVRTVYNYENGLTRPTLLVLKLYAMRCKVPLEWLEDGTEPPEEVIAPVTLCYPAYCLGWAA